MKDSMVYWKELDLVRSFLRNDLISYPHGEKKGHFIIYSISLLP